MNTDGKLKKYIIDLLLVVECKDVLYTLRVALMLFVPMKLSLVISILNHHRYVQENVQLNSFIFGLSIQKIKEDG